MSHGSLKEAYTLAHTAQCRLNIAASRPDRNLRFVVGHLMHYESLRLRIVEIEHDITKSELASTVTFQGTGHYKSSSKTPSTPISRKSPPPPPSSLPGRDSDSSSDSDDLPDEFLFDDEDDESVCGLGLQRFPSGSSRPLETSRPPPDLVPDNPAEPDEEDEDDIDPPSPPECDRDTLDQYVKGAGNVAMAKAYNRVKNCACHGKSDQIEQFERMWKLPHDNGRPVKGIRTIKAVAQVA